jgi:AcrR family transcriptional regulator
MNSGQESRVRGGHRQGKRQEVLAAATERFGRDGYEHTKWADIARDIGVGPTALYHYFESKQHCLYEIMDEAIKDFRARFVTITAGESDAGRALAAVLQNSFELSDQEVMRNRVLVAEQGLLSRPSTAPREEEARQAARARTREPARCSASTTASGTGTARTGS